MAKKSKLTPLKRENLGFDLLERYTYYNMNLQRSKFAFSLVDDDNFEEEEDDLVAIFARKRRKDTVTKYPLFLSQIALLYELQPELFKNRLNSKLLQFLADNFRQNCVFLVGNQGELMYILIMETNKMERKKINDFFAENLDDLAEFQFCQTEYEPELEQFFLNDIKVKLHQETCHAAITFF